MVVRRCLVLLIAAGVVSAGSAAAAPPQRPQPGPAVSYTDAADDAYRLTLPDGSSSPSPIPDGSRSNPALDLVRVDWGPAPETARRNDGGYTTAITIAGVATEDGSYVSYGSFTSGGKQCQLYHFLTPGITAFANAFCGSQETGDRTYIGRVSGSKVRVATSFDGTVLSAVFDNGRLPAELVAAGSTLNNLSAFTCMQGDEGLGCRPYETQDAAGSTLSYRLA